VRRAAVGHLLETFGWSEELGSLPQPAPPLEEVVLRVLSNSDIPLPLAAIQAAVEQDFGRSARGIEKALADAATRAREGKITLADLEGGVFTITNGGTFGSLLSTPIINPPQSGILGLHAIQERPVARDGQVVIRPMMYLAVSYDHRLLDGKNAVTFLVSIKEFIENPGVALLEIGS